MSPIVFLVFVWSIASESAVSRVSGEDAKGHDSLYLRAGPNGTLVDEAGVVVRSHARGESGCDYFPEIAMVQDVSASYEDDLQQLKQQMPDLLKYFAETFQGQARFGITSFIDKPVENVGVEGDYCARVDLPLTLMNTKEAMQKAQETFAGLKVSGGYDYLEGANEAMFRAAASDAVGWSRGTHDRATGRPIVRFLIVSTDAPVHHPVSAYGHLKKLTLQGEFPAHDLSTSCNRIDLNKEINYRCAVTDYPSAEDIRRVMEERGIIPIVFAGDNHHVHEGMRKRYIEFKYLVHFHRSGNVSRDWDNLDDGLVKYYEWYMRGIVGGDAFVEHIDNKSSTFISIFRKAIDRASKLRCSAITAEQKQKLLTERNAAEAAEAAEAIEAAENTTSSAGLIFFSGVGAVAAAALGCIAATKSCYGAKSAAELLTEDVEIGESPPDREQFESYNSDLFF